MMGYRNLFSGTAALTKFIFRRDRLRLLIWIVSLSVFVFGLVPVFEELIMYEMDSAIMVEMMKNPAMIAIVGQVYGESNYTLGAAFSNYMLLFSVMIAGAMNIFLVNRHTRNDEEKGRLEIVRSMSVGRLANLSSVMIAALIANILLSLFTTAGLYILRGSGMTLEGCFLFGVSLGLIGMFFAACTAVFCQISSSARTSAGLSFSLLLILYIIRGVGDVKDNMLSLISPLGLIMKTETFVNNYWWPVFVVKIITLVLVLIAFYLSAGRDLGLGVIQPRAGKRNASSLLSSPMGLAIRLMRTPIIIWAIVVFVLAAMYGSVFGDLGKYIEGSPALKAIFSGNTEFSLVEQFIGLLTAVMSMISSIPVLSFMNRVVSEEKNGMSEHILTKPVSRINNIMSYFFLTLIVSIIYQVLVAYGFWSAGSVVLEDIPSFTTFLVSTLIYLPAIWLMMGIVVLLIGFLPRKTFIIYLYLGYSFFIVYIGQVAKLPEWTRKFTPYGIIPQYPIEDINWANLLVVAIVTIVTVVIGVYGYRNRDIISD